MGTFGSLWGHNSLQTASEITYGLRFDMSYLNYLLIPIHIAYMACALLAALEATTASKQPQRSNLTSELKSVTSITYVSMSICAVIALISKMTRRRRRHLPPIDFAVAIAPLVKTESLSAKFRPKVSAETVPKDCFGCPLTNYKYPTYGQILKINTSY